MRLFRIAEVVYHDEETARAELARAAAELATDAPPPVLECMDTGELVCGWSVCPPELAPFSEEHTPAETPTAKADADA